jgi:hypothetical protein
MLTTLVLLMALTAQPAQLRQSAPPLKPGDTARTAPTSKPVQTSKQPRPVKTAMPPAARFSRLNCTLHYKLFKLHIAGGYSLNLPLTVFIEDETVAPAQPGDTATVVPQSVFSMPLLRDVNLGYQSRDRAFFISWLKRFQRPRVQLYFKLWI